MQILEPGEVVAILDETHCYAMAIGEVMANNDFDPRGSTNVCFLEIKKEDKLNKEVETYDNELGIPTKCFANDKPCVRVQTRRIRRIHSHKLSEEEKASALGREYGRVKLDAFHLLTRLAGALSSQSGTGGRAFLSAVSSAIFFEEPSDDMLSEMMSGDSNGSRVPRSKRYQVRRSIPEPAILLDRLSLVENRHYSLFNSSQKLQEVWSGYSFFLCCATASFKSNAFIFGPFSLVSLGVAKYNPSCQGRVCFRPP